MTPAMADGPRIRSVATTLPGDAWEQGVLFRSFFAQAFAAHPKAESIFDGAQVAARHFALDVPTFYARPRTFAERNDAYLPAARALGLTACEMALADAGLEPDAIDFFVVASSTGFAMPDLDVWLGQDLGLKRQVTRLTIGETGSHAALPAIARAMDHLRCYPQRRALVLVVEICSAALQLEPTGENVVAAAIFGDGAAAVVIEGSACASESPLGLELAAAGSSTYFDTAAAMTYRFADDGLHFKLSRSVPEVLAAGIGESIDGFLAHQGLSRTDIGRWVSHPGGRLILDRIEAEMAFTPEILLASRTVLNQVGNLAAATVLFVLAESLRARPVTPGEWILMLGYGPGLAIEMLLLRA